METVSVRFILGAALLASLCGPPAARAADLRGAWRPVRYELKSGGSLPVDGLIFFTEREWAVLFFVLDEGKPARGSAEGGTYTLAGDELVFRHVYHLSGGGAVAPFPESPLRMELHDASSAPTEPCRIEIRGDELTVAFGPSGNTMTFRRSPP